MLLPLLLTMLASASPCPLATPTILKQEKGGFTALWRFENSPHLHAPLREGELAEYERWVKSRTTLGAKGLIENHLEVGRRLKQKLSPQDPFRKMIEKNEHNALLVASGASGSIRPISCLESQPFRRLAAWMDLRTKPMEFLATILARGNELAVIADFYPNDYSGAQESAAARKEKARLRKKGWGREINFHNHPFNFANPYGDIGGTLAPSIADVGMYQDSRPREARITNGLHTVVFSMPDYSRFRR